METKMKTARPRLRNNAFGQGSILVRRPRNLRLLSELPADLPRSATVVAVRDATLSWLSRAEFEAFAEEYPEVYNRW